MDIQKLIKKRIGKTETGKPGNRVDTELQDTPTNAFVREEVMTGRGVVATFGRMNPPTIGHEKLVAKIQSLAKAKKFSPMVVLSKSTGDKKNPLKPEEKLALARKAFPTVSVIQASTLIQVLKELEHQFKHLCFVVGSDRVQDMSELLKKYNGREYHFETIEVISAGERDPDADEQSAMSASKLRAYARAGDAINFTRGLPRPLRDDAKHIMRLISENTVEFLEALAEAASSTTQQRMAKRQAFRRIKSKLKLGRKRAMMRRAGKETIERKARVAAKMAMRRRLLGGRRWSEIPLGTRASIDARLAKRAKVIDRVAKRLIPKLRRAEYSRKLGSGFVGLAKLAQNQSQQKKAMGVSPSSINKVIGDKRAPGAAIGEAVSRSLSMIAEDFKVTLTESVFEKLFDLAGERNVPLESVVECFKRGYISGNLQEAAGFARVHSFLNNGLAAKMDNDL